MKTTFHRFLLTGCIVLPMAAFLSSAAAQEAVPGTPVDSLSLLRAVLGEKRQDRLRMERMLEALNVVDSVYKVHYPTWMVKDDDLRERINRAFRLRFPDVQRDATVTVIANPESTELLELSVGSAVMGRRDTQVHLSDSLRAKILSADYDLENIDRTPHKPRTTLTFGVPPKFAGVTASAFGAGVIFNNGWGLEARLGFDEIGYHFWSSGALRVMAIFDRFKLGVIAPMRFGAPGSFEQIEPLSIRPRRLNGPKGISGEFEQPFLTEAVGAKFSIGELTHVTNPANIVDRDNIYYLHTIAQLYYSRRDTPFGKDHVFTLTGGVGYHQVARGESSSGFKIDKHDKTDFASPVLKVEYTRQGSNMYSIGVQYYSSIIYVHTWLELVKNFIFVDMKYYAPIVRGPKPWEQSYFFMVSPRIQVIY
jgi:hypothetical protein